MNSEENEKYRIYAFECRIIPFVAADALVKDKTVPSSVTGYPSGSVVVPPELRPTDTSGFYDIATQENRFSPPVETEGRSYFKLVSLIHIQQPLVRILRPFVNQDFSLGDILEKYIIFYIFFFFLIYRFSFFKVPLVLLWIS